MLKSFLFSGIKWVAIGSIILILGGIGGIIVDRYALPKIAASYPSLRQSGFFQKATETTTIINKTERIEVQESDSVEAIASQAASAVVNIVSVQKPAVPAGVVKTVPVVPAQSLAGSGVIVTNDGVITTYRTAILEMNAEYTVLLSNGQSYPAESLGVDPLTNLAFFKIDASNLNAIAFSNSDDAHPGKKLIALSNSSEEYQNRYAEGLLIDVDKTFSLSEKTVSLSEKWEGVIEMDLASPAKSLGGPAINYNGELVGIVGSARLDSQTNYFLIPANVVRQSLDVAVREGFDTRPTLGVYYVTITKVYALMHGMDRDRGALVSTPSGKAGLVVIDGSPADQAGLKYGDIIAAVNGREVNLDNPLPALIGGFSKGDTIELFVIRDGQEQKISVQL